MNRLRQIQGLQTTMATTIVMEVVTQTHVRFQPSRDLWEDEVTTRSNQKLCKWCNTPGHMELGCHLFNFLIDKKTSRARAISTNFIHFSLLFFLLFPTFDDTFPQSLLHSPYPTPHHPSAPSLPRGRYSLGGGWIGQTTTHLVRQLDTQAGTTILRFHNIIPMGIVIMMVIKRQHKFQRQKSDQRGNDCMI